MHCLRRSRDRRASRALLVRVATPGYHFGNSSHIDAREARATTGEEDRRRIRIKRRRPGR